MSAFRGLHFGAVWPGPALALGSALLFGASTPLAKLLLGVVDPWMLAALLYLGSGAGLFVVQVAVGRLAPAAWRGASLRGRDWLWFGGAVLAGGVAGPLLLMVGLARTSAATASLLLNLEGVATALLAWFVFRENFDRRIATGMAAVVAGAAVLSWPAAPSVSGFAGPLLVVAACAAWGLDNNLTRKVSLSDPVRIAMLKGLIAGTVNLSLALWHGDALPSPGVAAVGGVLGLFGYGVSIALFVVALRHLGAARTGAYFGTAPFVGAVIAVLGLGEAVTIGLVLAGALMALGVWLHLTERHEHEHAHGSMAHDHRHRHDSHHRHAHAPGDPPGEPHTHRHVHAGQSHSHGHTPDAHHDHAH